MPPDTLPDLVASLRPPLRFAAKSPVAASRLRLDASAAAARARSLQAVVGREDRVLLENLCGLLEEFAKASEGGRFEVVRGLLTLLDSLARDLGAPPNVITSPPAHGTSGGTATAYGEIDGATYEVSSGDHVDALKRLNRSVQFVKGVGPSLAEHLRKFGITTIHDLLYHLPFRYDDRRKVMKIRDARIGETVSLIGELTHSDERTVGRANRRILEAVLRDDSGLLLLTWYQGLRYFKNRYQLGKRLIVHGKIEAVPGGGVRMVHPEVDLAGDEQGKGILPVYEKPTTMTVSLMRKIVQAAAREFGPLVPSRLPKTMADQLGIMDLSAALAGVHLPAPTADSDLLNQSRTPAHRSLVMDELVYLQLGMLLRRRLQNREAGIAITDTGSRTIGLERLLPFQLTGAQRRVLNEIRMDMAAPHPMHRLVQGDVGSGKTIVAFFAALVAIENGYQAAFLAPTELLAEQHFRTVSQYAEALGVRTVLLTGTATKARKREIREGLISGDIHLAVGTHALIQDDVKFRRLGLGVIDEQHRFGVLQRATLRRASVEEGVVPDILLMSATPIPRTLSLTVYGDLDVSVIDELPPGRKPITTRIFDEGERPRAYQAVVKELQAGHQAYIIFPLVEESEKEDLRDATTMAKELARSVFQTFRVGLVHGRMKSDEKDAVMRRFRDGDLHVLVSTTVIEVGVDVANATAMVVEHAERFGLSQLHQLRGRVGRGGAQAYCFLLKARGVAPETWQRLKAMTDSNDGFEIAEIDLQLRGPGDFLGTRQSGLPDFRVANLIRDSRLLVQARQVAEAWLGKDPDLASAESVALKEILLHRWAGRLGLGEIG